MMKNYKEFQKKVDASFAQMLDHHRGKIQCQKGCHQCCRPDVTVSYVEKEAVKAFLLQNPDKLNAAKDVEKEQPHQGQRCAFLDAGGACLVYEARPIVCRSHGAPLQFRNPQNESELFRDVCPLNLNDQPLESLPPTQLLNLDSINAILTLINRHYNQEHSDERFPLKLESILS